MDATAGDDSGCAHSPAVGLAKYRNSGWPQYFSLFYNIVVAGAIMYWIYFTLLKRLTVAMSTIAMLAVPVVAVISDAFWLWKFPLWIDLGALGLIGVAVALALNKPA